VYVIGRSGSQKVGPWQEASGTQTRKETVAVGVGNRRFHLSGEVEKKKIPV